MIIEAVIKTAVVLVNRTDLEHLEQEKAFGKDTLEGGGQHKQRHLSSQR